MSKLGKTVTTVIPQKKSKDSDKFKDKESQKQLDEVRKSYSKPKKHTERGLYQDQGRVWTERSPEAFDRQYQSLGRDSHLKHVQLKNKSEKGE